MLDSTTSLSTSLSKYVFRFCDVAAAVRALWIGLKQGKFVIGKPEGTVEIDETELRLRWCSRPDCNKREEKAAQFKRCGRCRLACYCSVECQHQHWSTHKSGCLSASLPRTETDKTAGKKISKKARKKTKKPKESPADRGDSKTPVDT